MKRETKSLIYGIIMLCAVVSGFSFMGGRYAEMESRDDRWLSGEIKIKWMDDCQVFDFSDAVNKNGGITNETTKNLTLVVYNTLRDFIRYRLLLIEPQDWIIGKYHNGGVDFWKYYNRPPMTFEATCPHTSEHITMFTPGKKYVDTYLSLGPMWGNEPQIHFNIILSMTLHSCVNGSYISDEIRDCYIWIIWNNNAMGIPFEVRT